MDGLRIKYEALCNKEEHIRRELCRAQERQRRTPKSWVFQWLSEVTKLKIQVVIIERSLELMPPKRISNWVLAWKRSRLVLKLSKQADQLLHKMKFSCSSDELLGRLQFIVDQCPHRSQLLDTIWQNLTDPDVGITSIYGKKAVGKTTAMMKIMDRLAESDIFDTIILVSVSSNWSLHKVQNAIALQINLDFSMYQQEYSRADVLLEKLSKLKNFLIIFDDLCERIPLEEVGIPQPTKDNPCKIVLIGRYFDVCRDSFNNRTFSTCCESNHLLLDKFISVEVLSGEEAWELFVSKAGDVVLTPEIQPFARQVVKACPGLPILVIAAGHAMRDEVCVQVWSKIADDLNQKQSNRPFREDQTYLNTRKQTTQDMGSVFNKILRLSYTRLKNNLLRKCFLYCALFPQDYFFKPDELIRYWMAESLIHKHGDIVAEIDQGFMILRELQDANVLEIVTNGGEVWFKMHEFFRAFALMIIKKLGHIDSMLHIGDDHHQGNPSFSLILECCEGRRTSVIANQLEWLDVPIMSSHSSLSTLLLQDNPVSQISSSFFSRMLNLKFLDVSYSCITELPPSLSELAQLRALFLHYCTRLQKIPTLEKMKKLQYLSLCGTSITELPLGLESLASLRFLDLSETRNLENIRDGVISSLSFLEELRMRKSGICKMESSMVVNYLNEMRLLKRLTILTLSTVGSNNDLLGTIMCLQAQHLKIFSINVYGCVEDYIEDVETM